MEIYRDAFKSRFNLYRAIIRGVRILEMLVLAPVAGSFIREDGFIAPFLFPQAFPLDFISFRKISSTMSNFMF